MKYGIVMGLVAAFAASAVMAEGLPSQSKLNSLGLGSMNVVSDQQGEQVRGKAFFKIIASWQAAAGEKAIVDVDQSVDPAVFTISIDPGNFVAHDSNSGALIVTDGNPLTNADLSGSFALPITIQNTATAEHQQDILIDGTFGFAEISTSINSFTFSIVNPVIVVP